MGHTRLDPAQHIDPWSATLVRMAVAAVGLGVTLSIVRVLRPRRTVGPTLSVSAEQEHLPPARRGGGRATLTAALALIAVGAALGPVLGVWLSLVSVDLADAGIAATLMATTPVLILPLAVLVERERVSWRAAAGAVVALMGVFLLTDGG